MAEQRPQERTSKKQPRFNYREERRGQGSELAVCATHGAKRATNHMTKDAQGVWRCDVGAECRARPVAATSGVTCDLCGGQCGALSLEQHQEWYHGDLLRVSNEATRAAAELLGLQALGAGAVEGLGRLAAATAAKADGGREKWAYVVNCVQQLNAIFAASGSKKELRRAAVFLFGSCVAQGCWDGQGDIDCTLLDADGWANGAWPPKDEGAVVMSATRALRDAGFAFDDLEPLKHTRVPIVKHHASRKHLRHYLGDDQCSTLRITFSGSSSREVDAVVDAVFTAADVVRVRTTHLPNERLVTFRDGAAAVAALLCDTRFQFVAAPAAGKMRINKSWASRRHRPEIFHTDFDLSCRGHGVRNSHLLRAYMGQAYFVRMGSVFLKKWSKRSGVNFSMKGYLTSYAVNILWIYFLLRRGAVAHVPPESIPKVPRGGCEHDDYMPMLPARLRERDTATARADEAEAEAEEEERHLGETLAAFFHFYIAEFNWDEHVVSIKSPELVTKSALGWTAKTEKADESSFRNRVWYRFCVEDPYEENLSLGRHLSPVKVVRMRSAFAHALIALTSADCQSILADRTANTADDLCLGLLGRAIIGMKRDEQMPLAEVKQRINSRNPLALADYEVTNRWTKLLSDAGLILTHLGSGRQRTAENDEADDPEVEADARREDEYVVTHASGETVVPATAAATVALFDEKLSAFPGASLPSSEAGFIEQNLFMVFFQDPSPPSRVFRTAKDCEVWKAMRNLIKASFGDLDLEDDELEGNGGPLSVRDMTRRNVSLQLGADFCAPLFDAEYAELHAGLLHSLRGFEKYKRRLSQPTERRRRPQQQQQQQQPSIEEFAGAQQPFSGRQRAERPHKQERGRGQREAKTDSSSSDRGDEDDGLAEEDLGGGAPRQWSSNTKVMSRYIDRSSPEFEEYRRDRHPLVATHAADRHKDARKLTRQGGGVSDGADDDHHAVMVKGLAKSVDAAELRRAFSALRVRAVDLRKGRNGVHFAKVGFVSPDERDEALRLFNGMEIDGKAVRVEQFQSHAKPQPQPQPQPLANRKPAHCSEAPPPPPAPAQSPPAYADAIRGADASATPTGAAKIDRGAAAAARARRRGKAKS